MRREYTLGNVTRNMTLLMPWVLASAKDNLVELARSLLAVTLTTAPAYSREQNNEVEVVIQYPF
jgi:hypothetical protein